MALKTALRSPKVKKTSLSPYTHPAIHANWVRCLTAVLAPKLGTEVAKEAANMAMPFGDPTGDERSSKPIRDFLSWMSGVSLNLGRQILRGNACRIKHEQATATAAYSSKERDRQQLAEWKRQQEMEDECEAIRLAIKRLPEEYRQVCEYLMYGWSVREIASHYGRHRDTIYTWLAHIRRLLTDHLKAQHFRIPESKKYRHPNPTKSSSPATTL